MSELFNTATRKPDPIDDQDALHQALLTGTHSFPAGMAVTVTSPDGELGSVPSENIAGAIQAGYKVETPAQKTVREYTEANPGLRGAAKVAAGQFANQVAMGLPELVLDKTQDPLEVAKRQALEKEHSLANTAGGVGGFLLSMLAGAPLWRAGAKAGETVAVHVAEKLGAVAAEEIGKRTARQIAAGITAKAAGAGAEGAVIMAPHAITEAALGDPGAAAESLVAGVGVGALLGGGGAMAKELFGLAKDTAVRGAELVTSQKATAGDVARKIAQITTGVPEDDILHYVSNIDRVNASPAREEIKDAIDAAVAKRSTAVDAAREQVGAAHKELDDAYKAARFDLSRTTAPAELARELPGHLEATKGYLGSLSEQADDALERSGVTVKKKDLLKFLDDVGGSIGVKADNGERVLVSDEAVGASAKLKAQRDRIASFGDEISAPQLRGIMRDVRKDINYGGLAGEFNDTLNGARKTFSSRISSVLKDQSPEYAAYMERMHALSQNLEKAIPLFGDEGRALSTLNGMLSQKGQLNEQVLRELGQHNGRDFVGSLDQFKRANELLEASKRGDIREQLLPELSAKVKALEEKLEQAEAAHAPVKRLSYDRTQAVTLNQGWRNASINDRRALEELGKSEGRDFAELIRDRNALDSFSKAYANGSRKTLLGALLGGLTGGGPVGGAIGGAVGATADVYGGQILKKLIDANRDVSGLLFSERAMKATAERLDKIPQILDGMAGAVRRARPAATLGLMHLFSSEAGASGHTTSARPAERHKHLERFNEKASEWVANPGMAASKIASLTMPLTQGGAPQIGAAFGQRMTAAVAYLQAAAPKPPRPRSPFAPQVRYHPSDQELAAFEQKVHVVADPLSVLTELQHGTLTRNHMEALKAVYPALHDAIRTRVQRAVIDGVKPLPYAKRIKLSLLMDAPMDTSTTPQGIAYYQEPFAHIAAAEQQSAQDQGAFRAQVNVAEQNMTDADRVASRRG